MTARAFILLTITLCILAGCGDDDGTGPEGGGRQVATSLEITPANATITALEASLELSAVVRDQDGREMQGETVQWTSLDLAFATVTLAGQVIAQGEGIARVTASSGGLVDTAVITVEQTPAAIELAPEALLLGEGDTARVSVTVVDANGHPLTAGGAFAWSSDDEDVAGVDADGLVTVAADARGQRTRLTVAFGTVAGSIDVAVMDRLLFVSDRTGDNEVYVMNADGSGKRNLTRNAASDTLPAWSPDGSRIAFISDRATTTEVFVMDTDGANVTNVTNNNEAERQVAWRNANRLVYAGHRPPNFDSDILSVRADGTGAGDLVVQPDNQLYPRPSPDGSLVAFEDHGAPGPEIYLIDAGGTLMTQLTDNTGAANRNPRWSPDGSRIAFESTRDGDNEIYVMDADGSHEINISNGDHTDAEPVWSPDGTKLAFVAHRDGQQEIYMMNADGSGQTNLTRNAADDHSPAWSPDGSMIAFVSDRSGGRQVFVMAADGSAQTAITEQTGSVASPLWQPRSN